MQNSTGFKVKRQYERILEKLERPGVPRGQFRGVMTLLYIIASHYPRACPGQSTLAVKAMVTERTIRRWIANAVAWGWLEVVPDAGVRSKWSLSYTNLYVLTSLSEVSHEDKYAPLHGDKLSSRRKDIKSSKHRSTSYSHGNKEPTAEQPSVVHPPSRSACGRPTVEGVDKSRAEEIAAEAGDYRATKRPRAQDRDPSRRLANYFLDQWEERVRMEIPRYKDVRDADSIQEVRGYFRSRFLAPAAGRVYTEDEVRDYIDQFINAVRSSSVQVKERQSAFKRFTGWWGRSARGPTR